MSVTHCGAKTRPGAVHPTCHKRAGWGTDHVGQGKCKLHGGATPIRTGLYSRVKREGLAERIDRAAALERPLDMMTELAVARALCEDWIERYEEFREKLLAWNDIETGEDGRPVKIPDIADAYKMLAAITKIIERVEKVRRETGVSMQTLERLMLEWTRVMEFHVPDETTRRKIQEGWLAVRI